MVAEESIEQLRERRAKVLGEYARVKVTLSRENVLDAKGRRLESEAFHKWRQPYVRRYNELTSELVEINARLRELRELGS